MAYDTDNDPFAGGQKSPALSWKDVTIGSVFTLEVLEPAKLLHSRNFETNQPDYWDPPTNTQPKMSAVVNVRVTTGPHSVGEARSVWAQKPSNLFQAIAEAQTTANAKIDTGGTLSLKFIGEKPHENKRYSAIKQYQARYVPPAAQPDGFYEPPAGTQPQTPSTPPTAWPGAARPAQTAQSPQAPLTVCQRTRHDPVTGQPGGICGETAVTLLHGHPVCAAHQQTAQQGVGSSVPF